MGKFVEFIYSLKKERERERKQATLTTFYSFRYITQG